MQNNDHLVRLTVEECTMELRASMGDRIRIVFHPTGDDQDDYLMSTPKSSCFKIHDVLHTSLSPRHCLNRFLFFFFRIMKQSHSIVR